MSKRAMQGIMARLFQGEAVHKSTSITGVSKKSNINQPREQQMKRGERLTSDLFKKNHGKSLCRRGNP